ncbi:DUF7373 family lipoprotein [Nocardia carnea]|uniref:DUF7373 family lipoprotein n=1 Tax=Nocardia carnea TaxID=37328 RepID=UPI00245455A1|nr:hypothetical protein [Nocardia carnea]
MRRSDNGFRRLPGIIAAALVVAGVLTGCTVEGEPVAALPDPEELDTGPYGLELLVPPDNSDEKYGRILESMRMGEAVIDPVEADPSLTFGLGNTASVPVPTPATAGFLARPVRAVLERYGMLAGFSVGGMDRGVPAELAVGRARLLTVQLLRFPDDESARLAVAEIDSADAAVSPDNVRIEIPDHPGAHAHWRPAVPTMAAGVAHGPFVISVLAGHTTPDPAVLTGLVDAAFTAQIRRLADFAPTPPDELAGLPLDTDGMLARLLPEAPGLWPYPVVLTNRSDVNAGWRTRFDIRGVVYGPRAGRRWGAWEKSTEGRGMVLAVNRRHHLVRHPDVVAARRGFTDTAVDDEAPGVRPAPAPFGLPDSRCVESLTVPPHDVRFSCRVLYREYEAIVYGRTIRDTQQRAAAQYVLLVRADQADE